MEGFDRLLNEDESERRGDRFARWLCRFSPGTALDVGCSTGFLVQALRRRGVTAFGIDRDGSRFAQGLSKELLVVDAGKDSFPFPDESFDLVTAIGCLDYVLDYRHALDEIGRVAKPGGRLVMTFATGTRFKTEVRPSVFPKSIWMEELFVRGFSCDGRLARDWEVATVDRPTEGLAKYVPSAFLVAWRRATAIPFGCLVAKRIALS